MIDLPATQQTILAKVIVPALALLPAQMDTPQARVLLVAFGAQETGYCTRSQDGGPAHGLWQFEEPTLQLLLDNPSSAQIVRSLCQSRSVAPTAEAMYAALLTDDIFAAAIARVAIWCDKQPLPALGDAEAAFESYIRIWGPGAYTRGTPEDRAEIRQRFMDHYGVDLAAVTGANA